MTLRGLGGSTIRHRLASLASLFEYLCEKNAVTHNPVKGVERPRTESGEGKTPAITRRAICSPRPKEETIKEQARPRHPLHAAVPRAAPRRTVQAQGPGFFSTRGKACRISRSPARAARCGICRCIPAPTRSSTITSTSRPCRRRGRRAVPTDPQQPHRREPKVSRLRGKIEKP